jgi:hypothetical protein
MPDRVADTARRAAGQLAGELGPELPVHIEAALTARDAGHRPQQYLGDPASLASLVVAAATLAWTVYTDLRAKTNKPAAEVIERTIRVELRGVDATAPERRDRIVEVVVSEVIDAGRAQA